MHIRTLRSCKVAIWLVLAAAFGLFSFGIVSADVAVPGCDNGIGNAAQLQADVAAINANNENDVIQLSASCTYDLTATLTIKSDNGHTVTIEGNGATISGVHSVRVLTVLAGAELTLNNVTVRDGSATGTLSDANGGGIYNNGKLTINNSTISGNTAQVLGGGILNAGQLTMNNTAVSANHALKGGGIFTNSSITLNGSIVLGNTSGGVGGGIHSVDGSVKLASSAITANEAGTDGGGYFGIGNARLTLENSTVASNSGSTGGGIANSTGAKATLINTTIYGNVARDGDGGGIYNGADASVSLKFVTMAGNGAAGVGGGLFGMAGGVIEIGGTIIADGMNGGDCSNGGAIQRLDTNLIEDGTCPGIGYIGDPGLGAIEGFPGHLPLTSQSFVIDEARGGICPLTDQRGVSRPLDGDGDGFSYCDLGAYEAPSVPVVVTDIELLANGSFDEAQTRAAPVGWIVKAKTSDKYTCGSSVPTVDGPCAFRFKGSPGENSKLVQVVDLTGVQFTEGDTLVLSGSFFGANAATKAKLKLSVTYAGNPTPVVSSQVVRSQPTYGQFILPTLTIGTGAVQKTIVTVNNKSAAGKLYVDSLSLNLHLSSAVRSTPLPLPVAPANFRSNN